MEEWALEKRCLVSLEVTTMVPASILSYDRTRAFFGSTELAWSPLLLLILSFGSPSLGEGREEIHIAGFTASYAT